MTSRILISIVFIFLSCSLLSQSQDKNYIRHKTIWKSVTDENIINNNGLEDNELQENIVYFDGLGRELQEITVRKSPGNNDIIVPYKYDKFNHQSETFLPFTFQNDGNYLSSVYYKQKQFYSNPPENVIQSQYPVAKALYESSPLNRILEQGNVGEAWKLENGATTKYNYMTNSDGDARKWYFIYGGDGYCTSNEHYGEGELIKTEVIDENGNISCEYKDKSGKIVMKEASIGEEKAKTYYVYDDFGSLRYVIQPGVLSLGGLFTHFKWAFKYTYDNRKLLVEKMMPGMNEPQYMVYDSLYRLVLFQDGNMRLKDEKLWKFIKYDIFSRPVLEGFYTHSSVLDRQQMQEYVDNWIFSGGSFYEERTSGNYEVQQGYTDQAFPPLSNCEILKVYYYNHYDFDLNGYNNYDYEPDDINFPDNEWSDRNKGLLTGMKVRIMDKQWPDESWIVNVIFYDKYQRVIQEFRNHHTDGHLIVTNSFLFNSNIINKTKTYLFQPIEQEIITEYIFDHARRPVEIKQSLNGNNFITIAELKYNELGELVEKNLHKNPVTGNYLQSIDFTYNIRGWLTHINNPEIGGGDGDLFGMELIYDKGFDILNAEPQFNGNISAQKWSASNPDRKSVV